MKDLGLWLLIGVAVLAVVGALIEPGGTELRPAPDFSLVNLDDEIITLSDYRGHVVLLDFWASWCKPCVRTFPALHEIQAELADRGVALLVISLDKTEEEAREYLIENGFATENVLWSSLDEARAVKGLFGVVGIPHTFVVDRDGMIRFSGHPVKLSTETVEAWL